LLVSAEFWGDNARDRLERIRHAAVKTSYYIEKGPTDEFEEVASKVRVGQKMFHWPLEFPEVIVKRCGFDAFLGNPPFMGGLKLETSFGAEWRQYVVNQIGSNVRGVRGTADLCAYFFLRGGALLRANGTLGFIATNTIAQGDTRTIGLDQLLRNGLTILRSNPSTKWPGAANLEIAMVWMHKGFWTGNATLNAESVKGITAELASSDEFAGEAYCLESNQGKAFQGSNVMGLGFVIPRSEAEELLQTNKANDAVVFPYLNGQDVNSRPDQSPSRWIINFHDWNLERAQKYGDCLDIVRQRVKPERDSMIGRNATSTRRGLQWWLYAQQAKALYEAVETLPRVLVTSRVSAYLFFAFAPTQIVYADRLVVFAFSGYPEFALLSSSIHNVWAFRPGATTHETRGTYFPSSTFETFPFPNADCLKEQCEVTGEHFESVRGDFTQQRNCGLTDLYSWMNSSAENSPVVRELRVALQALDASVAAAYGWTDLELDHGFHETKQGIRFTISEPARREVLQRLLKLNHERYAEEVKQGLHDKKAAKKRPAANSNAEPDDPETVAPPTKRRAPKKSPKSKSSDPQTIAEERTLFSMEDDE
jgi:hypothetical protein